MFLVSFLVLVVWIPFICTGLHGFCRVSLPIGVLAGVLVGVTFKTPFAARPVSCAVREKLFSLDLLGACMVMGSSVLS